MKFKDLKVGDIIYVENPDEWYKPIKKTIGNIVPEGVGVLRLLFYTPEGEFIGGGIETLSQSSISGIFADFDTFKQYSINYQKNIIKNINYEMESLKEQLRLANDDLEIANELQEED